MVNQKLLQPQEIEVWYILPAIRRELAVAMKSLSLEQKEIARILGVSPAAVSNYFTEKRATEVKFDPKTKEQVVKAAKEIINDNSKVIPETQKLLKLMWSTKVVCNIHKEYCNLENNCEVCFPK
ncbi:hypothetical protein HY498_02275 [Candidatus Woesearchaeota archaeon]|nr:hypothetical protein [Candidatus Woesearchaeota archaeon]